jgi:hypothetical protein
VSANCAIPNKIVSGGQTGADRAALDWALAHGVECGGWCPKGRRAEDGVIPIAYPLTETPSSDYAQRTEWNVRDSDATVIFSLAPRLTGGSRLTRDLAARHGRPFLHLHPASLLASCCVSFSSGTEPGCSMSPVRVLRARPSSAAMCGGYWMRCWAAACASVETVGRGRGL